MHLKDSKSNNKTDQKLVEKKKQEEIKLRLKEKMSDRKNKIDKILVRWGVERKKQIPNKTKDEKDNATGKTETQRVVRIHYDKSHGKITRGPRRNG